MRFLVDECIGPKETLVERKVTYTLEVNGQLIVIENVPARVNLETGEQLFSPDTVEYLQQMIWEQRKPRIGANTRVNILSKHRSTNDRWSTKIITISWA
ncbi:MAG: YgiT-type zinc finger protein [Anaerolineae bacterium]